MHTLEHADAKGEATEVGNISLHTLFGCHFFPGLRPTEGPFLGQRPLSRVSTTTIILRQSGQRC